jgi:methionine-rich copper-binding protein CopC
MRVLITSIILALCPLATSAHSDMQTTTPQDGALLADVPVEIGLNFTAKMRLTSVKASHSGGEIQAIDLEDYKGFETQFTLPMPPMGPGGYDVEWRGLGMDGHAMQGTFSFEVE